MKDTTPIRIVVVSLFSGMDILMKALLKLGMLPGFALEINKYACFIHIANFVYPDGTPLIKFIEISKEVYDEYANAVKKNGKPDMDKRVQVFAKEVKYFRTRGIEDITGEEIRREVERIYGKNIIIILAGGPPCQFYCRLSSRKREIDCEKNLLVFEYLRILKELQPDIAIMEEVPEFQEKKFAEVHIRFSKEALATGYRRAFQKMNSLFYLSNQSRTRIINLFVHPRLKKEPVFPTPTIDNLKRMKDVFPTVKHWLCGHFSAEIATSNDFCATVTTGSPLWFHDGQKRWTPTNEDKLLMQDVLPGEYIIPDGIPNSQLNLAVSNGVPKMLGYHLGKTVLEEILCMKHVGDGWFLPIDSPDDGGDGIPSNNDSPLPVVVSPDDKQAADIATSTPELGNAPDDNNTPSPKTGLGEKLPEGVQKDTAIDSVPINDITKVEDTVKPQLPLENKPAHNIIKPSGEISPKSGALNINPIKPGKIISSAQLARMEFETLSFNGKWGTLFGAPSVCFFCIIHGLSGHGKSTFAIQISKYLADNFGRVLYISGEEGFSKTFQDKLLNTNSESKFLDVAELKTASDIIREVQPGKYSFIVIDSLDNMKIDPAIMRNLRATFKTSAFIAIAQSTKGGEIRGSYQLVHDSDIVVNVDDGLATTTKNRFKPKGTTFNVFEIMEPDGDTIMAVNDTIDMQSIIPDKLTHIDELELLLIEALTKEDFEAAAKLRDQISKIKNNTQ